MNDKPRVPDLASQYESLLDQIWKSEADWRFWDRIDAADRLRAARPRRKPGG